MAIANPNCMSYWYPRILVMRGSKEEVLMPETDMFAFDADALGKHWERGTLADTDIVEFFMQYCGQGETAFLRNGHTSGKHDWENACYLPGDITKEELARHIHNIFEFSLMHSIGRSNYWAIRKYILPELIATSASGMPLAAEYRFFVRNGEIVHSQPYWCPGNVDTQVTLDQLKSAYLILDKMIEEPATIAARVGRQLCLEYSDWSVDMMLGKDGKWYFIDAALAVQSFKWSGEWDQEITN